MSTQHMFINGDILEGNYYTENSSGPSDEDARKIVWRAHEIWRHAASQVSADSDEFKLSDAISNLKRAVNHRLQALNQAYSFNACRSPIESKRSKSFSSTE